MSMLATLRGRFGMALWERSLLYVTGGLATGDSTVSNSSCCSGCNPLRDVTSSWAKTPIGWAFGAGYEIALTRWLMVKAEYLHYDLGSNSTTVTYDYPGNMRVMLCVWVYRRRLMPLVISSDLARRANLKRFDRARSRLGP
jgi:opacity protein-like surface antigen